MNWIILLLIWGLGFSSTEQKTNAPNQLNEEVEMRIPASEFNAETIFHLKNINGTLKAVGYEGNEILITGEKIISDKSKNNYIDPDEIYLDRLSGDNNLFVFVRHPDAEVEVEGDELHYSFNRNKKNRSYDENELNFEFNLQIKIPKELMTELSTINGKEVSITGLINGASAENINGDVFISEVQGAVTAKTINGNVNVEYTEGPTGQADFETINGTIKIIAPKNLSAVVTFKSLHGELYTDFEQIKYLKNRKKRNKDGMNRFSIGVSDAIQFGEGGPEMRFELLNGNAYIKQRKS